MNLIIYMNKNTGLMSTQKCYLLCPITKLVLEVYIEELWVQPYLMGGHSL